MDRILKAARASGSLNLSNRSLREVPDEVYANLEVVGEGEKWWEAVGLHKLILAHNSIEVLKEELRNLPQLTVLNISHNKLTHLPQAVGQLPLLKLLDVSFNSIVDVPEEIGSATSLVKFDCSNNQLKELPRSLGNCINMSDFKASNNSISCLPEELMSWSRLTKLDVEGNKLTTLSEKLVASWAMLTELNASKNMLDSIPESIGNLSHLIRLDLHQNKISNIPSSIGGCSALAEFYMGNNKLSSLPTEIGALSHLGTFDLHSNQLKEFPVNACKLRLSVLDLSNNSLSGLPAEIGNMTTLRRLLLVGNPMRSLRSSLVSGPTPNLLRYLRSRLSAEEEAGSATSVKEDIIVKATRLSISSKELSLQNLGLTAVPSEVWESNDIAKLDLSKNSIEELPVELSSCSTLQVLILSRNKIAEWPSAMFKSLSNLTCLKLDNNPLKQIPADGLLFLQNLQILDLSGNAITLPQLTRQLQELYLRRMQLREVPSDILSLHQLHILDLSQNYLQSIPQVQADCYKLDNHSRLFIHQFFRTSLVCSWTTFCELINKPLQSAHSLNITAHLVFSFFTNIIFFKHSNVKFQLLVWCLRGIKALTRLNELDLSDNNISSLPPELGLLEPNLQALRVDGNPLRSIRRAILDRGSKAILNYLKDKLPEN